MSKKFDNTIRDAQSSVVDPVSPKEFDFKAYKEYADELDIKCEEFLSRESGALVYRRMRVAECFSYGCKNIETSLSNQLGALQKSIAYKADVPNFLEPWYGIGTIASAYGGDYIWNPGEAPALKPRFSSIDEMLATDPLPVAKSTIGKFTLNMIEYFMEQTKGELPVSFTDTQSPLNIMTHLLPMDTFLLDTVMQPEKVTKLLDIIADLSVKFNKEQQKLIGDSLILPGHGFASSKKWTGLGMSDDNIVMMAPDQYSQLAAPSFEKVCKEMGGSVFHSCGDWTRWIDAVLDLKDLKTADGAFSPETDPGAITNLEAFHKFAGTGVVLNTRIVGNLKTIEKQIKRLWVPGMKMIVVTYCQTPEEQKEAYDLIHEICK